MPVGRGVMTAARRRRRPPPAAVDVAGRLHQAATRSRGAHAFNSGGSRWNSWARSGFDGSRGVPPQRVAVRELRRIEPNQGDFGLASSDFQARSKCASASNSYDGSYTWSRDGSYAPSGERGYAAEHGGVGPGSSRNSSALWPGGLVGERLRGWPHGRYVGDSRAAAMTRHLNRTSAWWVWTMPCQGEALEPLIGVSRPVPSPS
jgi:hypothetical protein